jgi:broad specificity phosphatase PhoE
LPTTRLLLVRHGETLANREYRYIGVKDEPLSSHGQAQAQQLAQAVAIFPVAAVYSSPLQRAYQTAIPIAERHALEALKADALRECHFGTWEGLSRAEVLARSPEDAHHLQECERDMAMAPPAGESFADMQKRVCAAVSQLARAHSTQTIVLVSHVGPIKALLCAAMGAPLTSSFHIFLDPATISVVDWQDMAHATVRLVNSHAHLGWQQARWIPLV